VCHNAVITEYRVIEEKMSIFLAFVCRNVIITVYRVIKEEM